MRDFLLQVRELEVAHAFNIIPAHIPGTVNKVADQLSRVVLDDHWKIK